VANDLPCNMAQGSMQHTIWHMASKRQACDAVGMHHMCI
jgi:hypothetical protein